MGSFEMLQTLSCVVASHAQAPKVTLGGVVPGSNVRAVFLVGKPLLVGCKGKTEGNLETNTWVWFCLLLERNPVVGIEHKGKQTESTHFGEFLFFRRDHHEGQASAPPPPPPPSRCVTSSHHHHPPPFLPLTHLNV